MTDIVLHDTKTKQKKKLEPVVPGQVGMYVCGPTVYTGCYGMSTAHRT